MLDAEYSIRSQFFGCTRSVVTVAAQQHHSSSQTDSGSVPQDLLKTTMKEAHFVGIHLLDCPYSGKWGCE